MKRQAHTLSRALIRASLLATTLCPGVALAQSLAPAPASAPGQPVVTPDPQAGAAPAASADAAATNAAGAPQAGDGNLFGDIIVTAQKRSQSTQKIGLSISAFGGDQLETLGVSSVRDVAALVPGFTVAKSFRGPPIYTLRGVGFNTPNMSTSSPVGVYLDEVAYPYPIMTEGLSFDLERVEVLKGPQGTLYGRNTTGGLVNSIARRPTQELDGYIKASYGSYQSYGLEGAIGGGITNTLSARLAFEIDRSDKGWQVSVTRGDRLGKVDKAAARLSLLWEPSPNATFLLTGNWWQDKSDTQAAQAIYVYPKGLVTAGVPASQWSTVGPTLGIPLSVFSQAYTPTSASQANWVENQIAWGGTVGGHNFTPAPVGQLAKDNDMKSVALRADFKLGGGIKFTSLTSYASFNRNEGDDAAGWDIENAIYREIGSIRSFQQELRLTGESRSFSWIAGLFYAHDKIQETDKSWGATISTVGPLRVLGSAAAAAAGATLAQQQDILYGFRDWQNQDTQTVTSKAAFAQGEFRFGTLALTAGIRFNQDDAKFTGCSRDQGDNSIAATWNGFFNYYAHIPANVAPGGCVTYLYDLAPSLAPGGPPFPGQGFVNKELKQNNLSGRLALNWQANPDLLIYGYVARGFKSGAFPNIDANLGSQYNAAVQEEVIAYEAGVKSKPFAGATLNASVFYYNYKNKQVFGYVPDIIFTTLNRIVNIPRSHLYGAEIEASFQPIEGLSTHFTASYLHTRVDEYQGYDDFGVPRDFRGAGFTFTPKFQVNGVVSYGFALNEKFNARLTGSGRYSSTQHADLVSNPLFRIDPYTLFDANILLSTHDDKYEVELFVRNLTNKYYWNSVQLNQDSLARYAGMPRTWGVSAKARF